MIDSFPLFYFVLFWFSKFNFLMIVKIFIVLLIYFKIKYYQLNSFYGMNSICSLRLLTFAIMKMKWTIFEDHWNTKGSWKLFYLYYKALRLIFKTKSILIHFYSKTEISSWFLTDHYSINYFYFDSGSWSYR